MRAAGELLARRLKPHEGDVYRLLSLTGVATAPKHVTWLASEPNELPALEPGRRYVAKALAPDLFHKTDVGGIAFGVTAETAAKLCDEFASKFETLEGVLFAEEEPDVSDELILSAYQDPFFGPCVGLGWGGTAVEWQRRHHHPMAAQLFFPASLSAERVRALLSDHPVVQSLTGAVRGRRGRLELDQLLERIAALQRVIEHFSPEGDGERVVEELEMNPCIVRRESGDLVALDGVLRTRDKEEKKKEAQPSSAKEKPLDRIWGLLNPKRVAVVGVSRKNSAAPANVIVRKAVASGGVESVTVVHPGLEPGTVVEGVPSVQSIADLPHKVDLLLVGAPAKAAAPIVRDAIERGAADAIQIISSGFSETKKGKGLQTELKEALDAAPVEVRPVVNGPNTLGNIFSLPDEKGLSTFDTVFVPAHKSSRTGRGSKAAALVCQSGACMLARLSGMADVLNPRVAMSVGNQMDLSVTDCLEFLAEDAQFADVRSFGLYIEGLNHGDGRALTDIVRRLTRQRRFVTIYKAGRTSAGKSAAQGHTAALAGNHDMFSLLLREAGGMVVDRHEQLEHLMMLSALIQPSASLYEPRSGPFGIGALTNAGFEKCAIGDHIVPPGTFEAGWPRSCVWPAQLSSETQARVQAVMDAHRLGGLIDVADILDVSPQMNDEGYASLTSALLADESVDFGIISLVPETPALHTLPDEMGAETGILTRLESLRGESETPFCVVVESGPKYEPLRHAFVERGIPCFAHADAAVSAVSTWLASIRTAARKII